MAEDQDDDTDVQGRKLTTEELYDADPNCDHEYDPACWDGVRCRKCGGWFCY